MVAGTSSLIDDCMTLVIDCENRSDKLNDWERDQFIPSIRARLQRRIQLSDPQSATLDDIWKRVTKKGGSYVSQ